MTYVGRPEEDWAQRAAMTELGNGLSEVGHHEDALSVKEAELATKRRLGASEGRLLITQSNIAVTYQMVGRLEDALRIYRDVYSGQLKLKGEEHGDTLLAAKNYAGSLIGLERFEETKALLLTKIPAARRTLGESDAITLSMRSIYANALFADPDATLDDVRAAVDTLEETERIARRVLGGASPTLVPIIGALRGARVTLAAHETPPPGSS